MTGDSPLFPKIELKDTNIYLAGSVERAVYGPALCRGQSPSPRSKVGALDLFLTKAASTKHLLTNRRDGSQCRGR